MDLRTISLAIGKLSDEVEKLKQDYNNLNTKYEALKAGLKEKQTLSITPTQNDDELLTMGQLRSKLKLSRNSVAKLIEEGKIRVVRLGARTIRYVKSEIHFLFDPTKI